jgi:hypothetical protein
MKTEIRVVPHSVLAGANVIELWHDGQFIGAVVGADGPGVRVISKHSMKAKAGTDGQPPHVLEVAILVEERVN